MLAIRAPPLGASVPLKDLYHPPARKQRTVRSGPLSF